MFVPVISQPWHAPGLFEISFLKRAVSCSSLTASPPSAKDEGGIEGFAAEYWSPPPYWKDNKQYIGGSLASFNQSFLQEFGQARVADVKYLLNNGLKVAWWGLQNEPSFDTGASTLLPQRSSQPLVGYEHGAKTLWEVNLSHAFFFFFSRDQHIRLAHTRSRNTTKPLRWWPP